MRLSEYIMVAYSANVPLKVKPSKYSRTFVNDLVFESTVTNKKAI